MRTVLSHRLLVATGALALALIPAVTLAGTASAAPTTTDVPYVGSPLAIPDGFSPANPGAAVSAPVAVTGIAGVITKLTLSIDGTDCTSITGSPTVGLNHSFVEDLVLTLRSPDGTEVLLTKDAGSSGHNFCQTVFDDDATQSLLDLSFSDAPYSGSFHPIEELSAFNGHTPNGQWELIAQDIYAHDTGTIRAFSLHITTEGPSGTITVSGATTPGSTVTYATTLSNPLATATNDNSGNEFLSTLPAGLSLVSASATSGAAVANLGGNAVSWNGSIPAGGSVTLTIVATIAADAIGTITTEGTFFFEQNGTGTNNGSALVGPVTFAVTQPQNPSTDPEQGSTPAATLPEAGIEVAIPLGFGALLLALGATILEARRRTATK